MEGGNAVSRYQVAATFRDGVVEWALGLQLEDGERVILPIRDGEEVPILLDLCRRDSTIYYDPQTRTLRSGWGSPGDLGQTQSHPI